MWTCTKYKFTEDENAGDFTCRFKQVKSPAECSMRFYKISSTMLGPAVQICGVFMDFLQIFLIDFNWEIKSIVVLQILLWITCRLSFTLVFSLKKICRGNLQQNPHVRVWICLADFPADLRRKKLQQIRRMWTDPSVQIPPVTNHNWQWLAAWWSPVSTYQLGARELDYEMTYCQFNKVVWYFLYITGTEVLCMCVRYRLNQNHSWNVARRHSHLLRRLQKRANEDHLSTYIQFLCDNNFPF